MSPVNVLFVCTENTARSPLAEALFHELQGAEGIHRARSVGTVPHAPRRLTTRDVVSADLVAVMEREHLALIRRYWPRHAGKVMVLDVADHFGPGGTALREVLEPRVREVLARCQSPAAGARVAAQPSLTRPRPAKRAFDLVLAGVGLIASAPLWGLIAVLVKVADGGPVFYGQERVGQGGRRFLSLKFRSMVPDADRRYGPRQAGEDDPRITRVGRWLRATAMDELPQLWNIVRGDMSFVGPRALMPAEIEVNSHGEVVTLEAIPGYAERHLVRPGLTGLAQIYADRDIGRRHKFRYDRLYVRRQSFWLDLRLIALSFWISFRGAWEVRGQKF